MDIKYKIAMHTFWHCGSGLAAGADVDSLVVKDKDGLPFIPGKTIKGLLRDAIEEIMSFRGEIEGNDIFVNLFGYFDDKSTVIKSASFFSNAELPEIERFSIISNNAQELLYKRLANTAIDDNGTAKKMSLRQTEVVVPCSLYGEILNVNEGAVSLLSEAFCFIKRIGVGRNRGLGRCTFEIVQKGGLI
jgi:CRISPR/Cas system CSM-associated protein Csm3 (group 7 of RAMP superfamily)